MVWTEKDIADLTDKIIIITGANSGIGKAAAFFLAQKNATVILACRNAERGLQAEKEISTTVGTDKVKFMQLDLASLSSIKDFCTAYRKKYSRIDILVNNAGVMQTSCSTTTADGFEMTFGTNYLGHFSLTAQLFDLLRRSEQARIVNVSSLMHAYVSTVDYRMVRHPPQSIFKGLWIYAQSKLASLLFMNELQRRCTAAGVTNVRVVGCHPGLTWTALQPRISSYITRAFLYCISWLFQKPSQGCLPTCYAATAPEVEGGQYFGPDGFGARKGYPCLEEPSKATKKEAAMAELWKNSEELTGISFDLNKK